MKKTFFFALGFASCFLLAQIYNYQPNVNIQVSSNPPGANVYMVNKKKVGKTPFTLSVSKNSKFDLAFEKEGYLNETWELEMEPEDTNESISVDLEKIKIGLLNLSTRNASQVDVFMNDLKVKGGLPLEEYRLPAGRNIEVKAINRETKKIETININLKADEIFIHTFSL